MSKYGGWRSIDEASHGNNESIWWRDLKVAFYNTQQGHDFKNSTLWKVGCRDRIKFWEDQWLDGDVSLVAKYPRLYVISCQQNQIIQQMGGYKDSEWEWKFSWRRSLFDNEIPSAVSFLKDIESKSIQMHRRDDWVWLADPSGHYSAQSAYKLLRGEAIMGIQDQAFEQLWKLKVPTKVLVFAWRLLRDRLPTKSNLHRRQVEITDRSCPFCRSMEEDVGHLFFHCSKIIPIWWESLSWMSIAVALPQNPRQHFLQHGSIEVAGVRSNRWKWWWLVVTWTIWQQRNKLVFSSVPFDSNKLKDDAAFLIWTWLRNLEKDFSTHFNQWSSNLRAGFMY